jgi:hypothetical protein
LARRPSRSLPRSCSVTIRPSSSGQQPERMLSDPKPVLYRKLRRRPRPSAFAVDLARMRALTDPLLEASRVDEAGALPSGRVVLSQAIKRYYDPLRLPGGRLPLPGLAGYRQALLPQPRRLGATEGLSSSHDNLPTVPRPLRRRVPWHPLQAPRCRPWPSPQEYRLGSLLAVCAVILNDAAGFASCCGPVGCPPLPGAVFPRFDLGLSPDAGSAATGDPGVSPDRTHTGWLP